VRGLEKCSDIVTHVVSLHSSFSNPFNMYQFTHIKVPKERFAIDTQTVEPFVCTVIRILHKMLEHGYRLRREADTDPLAARARSTKECVFIDLP